MGFLPDKQFFNPFCRRPEFFLCGGGVCRRWRVCSKGHHVPHQPVYQAPAKAGWLNCQCGEWFQEKSLRWEHPRDQASFWRLFHMLRPNCFLSFITLNPTPKDWNTWICWKHPRGATDSNTSSPQWQWYCTCLNYLKLLYRMVYDGRMHILSHVLLSHEAQQSLHHTAIVRSGGVSGTPSNAPKRLPLQTVVRRRFRPRFWWVKYYNEGKWSLNPIENLWREVKNKVRIGRSELIMHFCQLLWCLSYSWQKFFAGWNPRLASKKDV